MIHIMLLKSLKSYFNVYDTSYDYNQNIRHFTVLIAFASQMMNLHLERTLSESYIEINFHFHCKVHSYVCLYVK